MSSQKENIIKAVKPNFDYSAKIKVVGVGGGGGNAVSRMSDAFNLKNVDFIAINTDSQDLDECRIKQKIYVGKNLTRGLGTGMNPELGRQAVEESRSEITEALKGADLVFITAGLGGGSGSGGSPGVAEVAREVGALTVGVVTKPFAFEGSQRARIANEALAKLKEKVDALIVIPNDRIFSVIQKDTPIIKAFEYIDDILKNAVQGVAEMIAEPGIINVDFADVKAIMQNAGSALVGIGVATGQDRAMTAVAQAINSPLLEASIEGAKGVLFAVTGTKNLKMSEINDVAKIITESVDPAAKIIFGAYYDRNLTKEQIKVTLVATGFNGASLKGDASSSFSDLFSISPAMSVISSVSAPSVNEEKENKSSEKINGDKHSKKSNSEVWDIPAFLRKKRK